MTARHVLGSRVRWVGPDGDWQGGADLVEYVVTYVWPTGELDLVPVGIPVHSASPMSGCPVSEVRPY